MSPFLIPMSGLPGCKMQLVADADHERVDSIAERIVLCWGRPIGRVYHRGRPVARGTEYGWYTAECRRPRTLTEAARLLLVADRRG